jgi:hypothetical protein
MNLQLSSSENIIIHYFICNTLTLIVTSILWKHLREAVIFNLLSFIKGEMKSAYEINHLVCVCVCVCACTRVHACMHTHVRVTV